MATNLNYDFEQITGWSTSLFFGLDFFSFITYGKFCESNCHVIGKIMRLPSQQFPIHCAVSFYFIFIFRILLSSINQQIDRSTDQSVYKLIDRSFNQQIDQSIDQLTDRSINQQIDQSIHQQIDQSINPWTDRSTNQSIKPINQQID